MCNKCTSLNENCTNYGISLVFVGPFSLKTPSEESSLVRAKQSTATIDNELTVELAGKLLGIRRSRK